MISPAIDGYALVILTSEWLSPFFVSKFRLMGLRFYEEKAPLCRRFDMCSQCLSKASSICRYVPPATTSNANRIFVYQESIVPQYEVAPRQSARSRLASTSRLIALDPKVL
jgi:hypothetical protein